MNNHKRNLVAFFCYIQLYFSTSHLPLAAFAYSYTIYLFHVYTYIYDLDITGFGDIIKGRKYKNLKSDWNYEKKRNLVNCYSLFTFFSVAVVAATRNHPDVLENVYRSIQAAYMFTKTCKILFFVRKQTSLSSMMIILECVASEKMEEIIINRKSIYDFDIVKEWTSRDIDMIPDRTVIKVDVRGKFSMPKEAKIKSPAIYCNPFGRENFNRFQVELSQRVGGSLFGILSFRNTKHVIDEIFYDPSSRTKVPNKSKSGYRIMRNEREVKTSRNQHSKGINKL